MIPEWQSFLLQQHAVFQDGLIIHFSNTAFPSVPQGTVLCNLEQFGTLRVSGIDSQQFLQNLFSNDIREVNNAQAQPSSFNSAKGRMLATFLIWRDGDDYLLQLPQMLLESMRKKLSMYVLRAKVKITDSSNEIISLGLSGDKATEILRQLHNEELPVLGVSHVPSLSTSIIRISDTRFQLNTTLEQAPTLWQLLATEANTVGSAYWDWLNIHAGIPVILPQTQEQFVPQMANLDLIGGINFKKGCYPGQEIVARMHYLGKLKRRMYLAHISTDIAPRPGDELFSADMAVQDQAQTCGMVVNSTLSPAGGYDILAVIQIASHDTQSIHLDSLQGPALTFEKLPYSLP